jgi:hypothetical protein
MAYTYEAGGKMIEYMMEIGSLLYCNPIAKMTEKQAKKVVVTAANWDRLLNGEAMKNDQEARDKPRRT